MTVRSSLIKNALFVLTILSVLTGISLGLFSRSFRIDKASFLFRIINFPGEIFFRGIKLLIIPLISSSLIVGIAGPSVVKKGAIARRTFFLFLITTLQSIILAFLLAIVIKPGKLDRVQIDEFNQPDTPKLSSIHTFLDLFRNLVPDNLIEIGFLTYRSKIKIKSSIKNFCKYS